ncbi:unnamed protein product, partial [Urochloa humidicola]
TAARRREADVVARRPPRPRRQPPCLTAPPPAPSLALSPAAGLASSKIGGRVHRWRSANARPRLRSAIDELSARWGKAEARCGRVTGQGGRHLAGRRWRCIPAAMVGVTATGEARGRGGRGRSHLCAFGGRRLRGPVSARLGAMRWQCGGGVCPALRLLPHPSAATNAARTEPPPTSSPGRPLMGNVRDWSRAASASRSSSWSSRWPCSCPSCGARG